jgi:putative ABC transport system ATP-binding protein
MFGVIIMNEVLRIESIEKYYGNKGNIVKAIDDISFRVKEGEFVGVMGQSGSGKTTLLNLIATIDNVSSGNIYLDGRDLTEINKKDISKFRRENLGFIFQDFNLLDTLSIHENIALALTINGTKKNEIDDKISDVARKLGIEDILSKYPYEVSGGQKQRTACARALVTNPKLILADEPTGALDSKSAQMLIELMSNLNKELQATILMVTHDSFTASYCDRILFIKDGKIFTELIRGENTRRQFFNKILDVVALLGGDVRDVR